MITHHQLVMATNNKGKLLEVQQLFKPYQIEVKGLEGYTNIPDVIEDRDSFLGNAKKKAKEIAEVVQSPVIADDSGLCVEALGGAPGIYSARYAGAGASDKQNNEKLLAELKAIENSTASMPDSTAEHSLWSRASFVCALVYYSPDNNRWIEAEGRLDGYITSNPQGEHGFGYDPLFYVSDYKKTLAELSSEEKNRISHRAKALAVLLEKLKTHN